MNRIHIRLILDAQEMNEFKKTPGYTEKSFTMNNLEELIPMVCEGT
jgi:hypothetical protein